MKNIAVVGGGPIGLYLAIRLSHVLEEVHVPMQVVVIEPRLDEYNTPGFVAKNVLDVLTRKVALDPRHFREGGDNGSSIFIMDLETALCLEAKKHKIRFIKAEFVDLQQGQLQFSNGSSLSCSITLDCTGSRRLLVRKINEKHPSHKRAFTIERIADNPVKHHLAVHTTMNTLNARLITDKIAHNPLKHVLTLERLRHEFGWPEFIEPELGIKRYALSGAPEWQGVYFYVEIPPKLFRAGFEELMDWLKAVIQLKTELESVDFIKNQNETRYRTFQLDPCKVTEPLFQGGQGLPKVIPCGGAQIDPDYGAGIGLRSGLFRAEALMDALKPDGEFLTFVPDIYERKLREPLGYQERLLVSEYQRKRKRITAALRKEKTLYAEALTLATDPDEQAIIQAGLNDLQDRHCLKAV
ncbi:FAD-dependent monooxygenase family protein [Legionella spiritensis]|uniref:Uncharacterized protein n=1 Tax=Legionella spiritensis TaxID=452 RepID=A0A0W0YW93_LEGSP|nr:hypothetical protein [Legionella spiritensis]KTD61108.1 hypothetical protein Lspi_2728 [Legionella spiritensis]SNV44946.1 Uncharacterised protein [Legionella spiritensis]